MLEFLACISLRYRQPDLPRPFRIWGPNWVVVAVMTPPLAIVLVLAYATAGESALTASLCFAGVAVGVLVFHDPIGWPYQVVGLVLSFVGALWYGLPLRG